MANKRLSPLLVIVGETASGKSELALKLAQQLNGEIICADAYTVRRGADIGTAKPSKEDRALIPHHLLDVVGPKQAFNASDFKQLASHAIEEISSKGKLPIMVGGTGLYIDGVLYDYSFLPSSNNESREELVNLSKDALLNILSKQEIDTTSVDINNKRRLVRLIETGGIKPTKKLLRDNAFIIGLKVEREELKNRITQRADNMLASGLEKEVFELSRTYGWDCEAMNGISYSEWHDYFLVSITKAEVRENIIKDCMNLAKRQTTWFKRNKSIHWITAPVNYIELVEQITTQLGS